MTSWFTLLDTTVRLFPSLFINYLCLCFTVVLLVCVVVAAATSAAAAVAQQQQQQKPSASTLSVPLPAGAGSSGGGVSARGSARERERKSARGSGQQQGLSVAMASARGDANTNTTATAKSPRSPAAAAAPRSPAARTPVRTPPSAQGTFLVFSCEMLSFASFHLLVLVCVSRPLDIAASHSASCAHSRVARWPRWTIAVRGRRLHRHRWQHQHCCIGLGLWPWLCFWCEFRCCVAIASGQRSSMNRSRFEMNVELSELDDVISYTVYPFFCRDLDRLCCVFVARTLFSRVPIQIEFKFEGPTTV